MSIAALITQGIGPGGSIPYLLTGGLDLGAPAPPPPPAQTSGGSWGYIGTPSRRDEEIERKITVAREDVPVVIEQLKIAAETKAERRAAARAAEMLSKTQPVIDLDAPWVKEFIRAVLMRYMAERERIQRNEDEALILLMMH